METTYAVGVIVDNLYPQAKVKSTVLLKTPINSWWDHPASFGCQDYTKTYCKICLVLFTVKCHSFILGHCRSSRSLINWSPPVSQKVTPDTCVFFWELHLWSIVWSIVYSVQHCDNLCGALWGAHDPGYITPSRLPLPYHGSVPRNPKKDSNPFTFTDVIINDASYPRK